MAGLQRSAVSFRRQGSSGLVFDDKFLSGELNKAIQSQQAEQEHGRNQEDDKGEIKDVRVPKHVETLERSRSNGGGRGYRTGNVPPAIEPPSPRVSACGFCSAFTKPASKTHRRKPAPTQSVGQNPDQNQECLFVGDFRANGDGIADNSRLNALYLETSSVSDPYLGFAL